MKVDLHCHSKYSHDTYLEPERVIERALRCGLDGVCFTEHFSLGASLPIENLIVPKNFVVFRGLEVSTDAGHLLVYGLTDDTWNIWSRNHYLKISGVIDRVHQLGGICAAAHPFRGWDALGDAVYHIEGLDAIETLNGMNTDAQNRQALQASRARSLPSIGGSDCHEPENVGRAFTVFQKPVRTAADLIGAIRRGECRAEKLERRKSGD